MADYTPYQQRAIKNYYDNLESNSLRRLGELATDLYLAEGKKRANHWKQAVAAMEKLGVPAARIQTIVEQDDPVLLVKLAEELGKKA